VHQSVHRFVHQSVHQLSVGALVGALVGAFIGWSISRGIGGFSSGWCIGWCINRRTTRWLGVFVPPPLTTVFSSSMVTTPTSVEWLISKAARVAIATYQGVTGM
jgi:hypothetical protein